MKWKENIKDSWFYGASIYAGKDHTKSNKTFICLNMNENEERTGFKTLEAAKKKAIELWVN